MKSLLKNISKSNLLKVALFSIILTSCEKGTSANDAINNSQVNSLNTTISSTIKTSYKNPLLTVDFPDPTVLKASDGMYYAYATQGYGKNIQTARSKDMVQWEVIADSMPTKPKWASDTQNFWAPHVIEDKGKYYMYFSAEIKGLGLAIGVATSDSPEGPFIDSGNPLAKGESFVNIDPMAFDDPKTGKKYLYWGSGFQPIKVQELDQDRIHMAKNSKPIDVVKPNKDNQYENLIEGAWTVYRNGYYYIFYSGDNCCDPVSPNYAVMVARSKSPTGPFQKLGEANGKGKSVILEKNEDWTGVGHNAIFTDAKDQDWIVYHGVNTKDMYVEGTKQVKRALLMDKLTYKNGWPQVISPSKKTQSSPAR